MRCETCVLGGLPDLRLHIEEASWTVEQGAPSRHVHYIIMQKNCAGLTAHCGFEIVSCLDYDLKHHKPVYLAGVTAKPHRWHTM